MRLIIDFYIKLYNLKLKTKRIIEQNKMWDELLKNPEKLKKINQTAFDAIDLNNDGNIQKNEL